MSILKRSKSENVKGNEVNEVKEALTTSKLFEMIDERYKKKFIMFKHLQDGYEALINNIVYYFQNVDHIFSENKIGDLVYRYSFKYDDIHIRPAMLEGTDTLLTPMDCIDKKLTYSLKIIATISQVQEIYNFNTKQTISSKIIEPSSKNDVAVQLPIAVRSKYCSLEINRENMKNECEFNGNFYYIVNGNEKVVMSIEQMIENKPLVFTKKEGDTTYFQVQINSRSTNPNIMMQSVQIRVKKNYEIVLKVPIFDTSAISVFVVMRALGLETDKEIINYITYNENDIDMINILKTAINLSKKDGKRLILTKNDAHISLSNKLKVNKKFADKEKKMPYDEKREHLEYVLRTAFLPHINPNNYNDVLKVKAIYLGMMVHKLLNCFLGRTPIDNRDSFLNKVVNCPNDTIFELFKTNHKKVLNDSHKIFVKRFANGNHDNPPNIVNQMKPNTIKQNIESAMLTGTFGNKTGVAQPYQRLTYFQSLELLRRVDSPSLESSTNKLLGPRHYDSSQVGMLCPVESPEHAKIGLVKHLSLIGSITTGDRERTKLMLPMLLENKKVIHIDNHNPLFLNRYVRVILNGEWIGVTLDAFELYKDLRGLKRHNIVHQTTGIVIDLKGRELRVRTDGGRLYQQVLTVENNEILLTDKIIDECLNAKVDVNKWDYMLAKYPEVIDCLDVDEQYYALVAFSRQEVYKSKKSESLVFPDSSDPLKTGNFDSPNINRYDDFTIKRYTHCIIHPQLILGIIASNIPFANHNQGPRNIFQYAQGKQAMGIYASNHRYRIDISYILFHCQRALVNTRVAKYSHGDILPCGENAIVMIASYTGHNQEDSIVMNLSAIQRGLFRSTSIKGYDSSIEKNHSTSQNDIFTKPDPSKLVGQKYANYDKLNDNGYVPEETIVYNNDVIIGKVTPIQPYENSNKCLKDSSTIYKGLKPATISKVFTGITNAEGYDMIKIKTSSERIPEIGDKFCSKHGNKGTVGLTLHASDMPFTEDGISPDIIINPIGVSQRRTIAQLLESVLGKVSALKGCEGDGTAFEPVDSDGMMDELEKLGFNRNGTETMYSGITGEKLKIPIFIGPTYYQRLKHLVADKIHSRTRGPKSILVRQPPEGRSHGGGLRLGEMERDCIIAHGTSRFLREKFMENSDAYNVHVCNICGLLAQRTRNKNYTSKIGENDVYECKACSNSTDISQVVMPYAFKLLIQELMCLGIKSAIRTKKYKMNVCDTKSV